MFVQKTKKNKEENLNVEKGKRKFLVFIFAITCFYNKSWQIFVKKKRKNENKNKMKL